MDTDKPNYCIVPSRSTLPTRHAAPLLEVKRKDIQSDEGHPVTSCTQWRPLTGAIAFLPSLEQIIEWWLGGSCLESQKNELSQCLSRSGCVLTHSLSVGLVHVLNLCLCVNVAWRGWRSVVCSLCICPPLTCTT